MPAKMLLNPNDWERVNATTDRLDVPGGWLYRTKTPAVITFVADPPLSVAIARAASSLGTGNAATPMGAIEAHASLLKEAAETIAFSIDGMARNIADVAEATRGE